MKSGRTLWGELCHAYDRGVRQVRGFQEVWDSVEPFVDARRFGEVQSKLKSRCVTPCGGKMLVCFISRLSQGCLFRPA